MENQSKNRGKVDGGGGGGGVLDGFSPVSSTRIDWKSRKRSASGRSLDKITTDQNTANEETPNKQDQFPTDEKMKDANPTPVLSERRKALFEPLEPRTNINGGRPSNESLLPPPDFDTAAYPRGWLIGKKRKLVNVDVVESMRRIAVQEMNRKDREIDELNEVVEEDGRVLEHLQMQLLEERAKKADVERENAMLRDQINMLMDMLQADEGDEAPSEP